MKLYVFGSAKMHVPDRGMMSGRPNGKPVTIPVPFYLIVHPKGLALFDTGMNLDNWPPHYKQDGEQRADQMIDKQLDELGYGPDDVKYVIMSHLRLDHAGGMPLFPKATFIVRKSELRAAWWPERFQVHYILKDCFSTRNFNFIELNDEENFGLFLDGSAVCIDTKGHSQGHQSVVLNLPNSGTIVLPADTAAKAEILDESVLPAIVWNAEAAMRSLVKIQHMKNEGSMVLMAHDPEQWETTRLAPEYYD